MSFSTAVAVMFVYLFSLQPQNVPYNAERVTEGGRCYLDRHRHAMGS